MLFNAFLRQSKTRSISHVTSALLPTNIHQAHSRREEELYSDICVWIWRQSTISGDHDDSRSCIIQQQTAAAPLSFYFGGVAQRRSFQSQIKQCIGEMILPLSCGTQVAREPLEKTRPLGGGVTQFARHRFAFRWGRIRVQRQAAARAD
jgi:hypothetical protein